MSVQVRLLAAHEAEVLSHVAAGVFDHAVDPHWCAAFLADPRHQLVVALDGDVVVGMASGVHYLHPDKPDELFISEAAVAEPYRSQGIGRSMLGALLAQARTLGCETAWVLTESDNEAARRMYAAAGGVEQPDAPVMIEFRP
ncbi:MAG TPA: GNAT family N-acetyltransferase [Gemmatimonadaceae bacterium]|nr:GNAT family N-acetyltransferase [Gemmatimonadaceae bacterium]